MSLPSLYLSCFFKRAVWFQTELLDSRQMRLCAAPHGTGLTKSWRGTPCTVVYLPGGLHDQHPSWQFTSISAPDPEELVLPQTKVAICKIPLLIKQCLNFAGAIESFYLIPIQCPKVFFTWPVVPAEHNLGLVEDVCMWDLDRLCSRAGRHVTTAVISNRRRSSKLWLYRLYVPIQTAVPAKSLSLTD